METDSLDNILNGTSATPEAPEVPAVETPPAEVPQEAAPEQPRDEHGRFLSKGEQLPAEAAPAAEAAPGAPPAPSEDDSPTVPRKALIDERNKRQTLESQLAEMSQRLAQVQQQPQQPPPVPDQWEDPDGFTRHVAREAANFAREEAVTEIRRERVIQSAEAAKLKYPDYLEKVDVFERLSAQNPELSQQMFQHPNPAEFAYTVAKNHEEVSQYGSLEARDAALKTKWEAEALERLKATLPGSFAPPTLSNERNVGQRSGPEWSGPKPLEDVLNS